MATEPGRAVNHLGQAQTGETPFLEGSTGCSSTLPEVGTLINVLGSRALTRCRGRVSDLSTLALTVRSSLLLVSLVVSLLTLFVVL